MKLDYVDLSSPDEIREYLMARHAKALQGWAGDPLKLRYDDPGDLLRARVYEVGCKLLRERKPNELVVLLNDLQGGRGRKHANVFSAVFGLLDGKLSLTGFSGSACRKAAAVMILAQSYDIHPMYVATFAERMKGWSTPVDTRQLAQTPVWIKGLTRAVQK